MKDALTPRNKLIWSLNNTNGTELQVRLKVFQNGAVHHKGMRIWTWSPKEQPKNQTRTAEIVKQTKAVTHVSHLSCLWSSRLSHLTADSKLDSVCEVSSRSSSHMTGGYDWLPCESQSCRLCNSLTSHFKHMADTCTQNTFCCSGRSTPWRGCRWTSRGDP